MAAAGVVVLTWLVFSILLSTWHLTNASQDGLQVCYAGSILVLTVAAIYVTRELLRLAGVGVRPLSRSVGTRGGSPPGALPLTGAPCPVPIRPTPHLTRSAAERLPVETQNRVDAISGDGR